jgi:transcription elongation factor GreA
MLESNNKFNLLVEKVKKLKENELSLIEKLKMARLDGDLKENADWLSIKEKLNDCQKELNKIEKIILSPSKGVSEKRFFTYSLLETNEVKQVELTDDWEADPAENKISYSSPLGSALVNKNVGEILEIKTKTKNYKIKIIDLK